MRFQEENISVAFLLTATSIRTEYAECQRCSCVHNGRGRARSHSPSIADFENAFPL